VNFISIVSGIPTSRYSMLSLVHLNEVKQTSKNRMSHFFKMSRIKVDNHSIHLVYHVPIVPLVFFNIVSKMNLKFEFFLG